MVFIDLVKRISNGTFRWPLGSKSNLPLRYLWIPQRGLCQIKLLWLPWIPTAWESNLKNGMPLPQYINKIPFPDTRCLSLSCTSHSTRVFSTLHCFHYTWFFYFVFFNFDCLCFHWTVVEGLPLSILFFFEIMYIRISKYTHELIQRKLNRSINVPGICIRRYIFSSDWV
jgi:hypothetical protein